jgi:hypothetical protein
MRAHGTPVSRISVVSWSDAIGHGSTDDLVTDFEGIDIRREPTGSRGRVDGKDITEILVTGADILSGAGGLNGSSFDQIGDLACAGIILAVGATESHGVYRGSRRQSGVGGKQIRSADGGTAVETGVSIQAIFGNGGVIGQCIGIADVELVIGDGRTGGQWAGDGEGET